MQTTYFVTTFFILGTIRYIKIKLNLLKNSNTFLVIAVPFYNYKMIYPGIQFRLPCTPPGQFFMGAKLFIGTPWMGNEGVLKKFLVWAM